MLFKLEKLELMGGNTTVDLPLKQTKERLRIRGGGGGG